MFADDCMIFCKASKEAARNIKEILHNYCMVFGELVNFHKSLILFSKEVPKKVKLEIANILQIPSSSNIGTYHGCKNIDRKRTRDDFMHIKKKIANKLPSWKARVLSQTSKAVLIKSNLTGVSSFVIQGVKIPIYITKDLDNINRNFFWNNNMGPNNPHGALSLISWDKICRPKCEGDLRIRKVQDVNAAFLAKLGWKILKDPNNLWVKVVSAMYLSINVSWMSGKLPTPLLCGSMCSIIDIFSKRVFGGA